MTDSMTDQVARAIRKCTDEFSDPVHYYIRNEASRRVAEQMAMAANNKDWDRFDDPSKDEEYWEHESYKIIARAAIEAMREPTNDMIVAGDMAEGYGAKDVINSMIDVALKEIANVSSAVTGAPDKNDDTK